MLDGSVFWLLIWKGSLGLPSMASIARTVATVAELKVRVNSILACAKISKPDCYTLSEELNRIYSDSAYLKLPKWAKESVSGYVSTMRQVLTKEYTILLSTGLDGRKMVGKWDDLTEAEREHIRAGNSLPSAFYWLECKETCTDSGIITKVMTPTDNLYFRSES